MTTFDAKTFLPRSIFERITDARISDPETARCAAQRRMRRRQFTMDGRLNLLAADHPARRVNNIGSDPLALADRHEYLARIVRALQSAQVDGVMATMDILEEMLVLDEQSDATCCIPARRIRWSSPRQRVASFTITARSNRRWTLRVSDLAERKRFRCLRTG